MQISDLSEPARRASVLVQPSLAIDISWVLHAGRSPKLQERHPALGALFDARPELAHRIDAFWEDDCCFGELEILTGLAGAFECTDLGQLLERLNTTAAKAPPELRLWSEPEADRQILRDRLSMLCKSTQRRKEYFELLGDLWSPLDAEWQSDGRRSIDLATERFRRQLDEGIRWPDLIPVACAQSQDVLPDLVAERATRGVVLLVPSYFFGTSLFLDLPDLLLIGLPSARGDAESRARTETVARRLKTLADPTRLAILDYLAGGPRAVGEIARTFDLAQPTVSAHVKLLREAGIVTATRNGSRLEHRVDPNAVDGLLDQLRGVFS